MYGVCVDYRSNDPPPSSNQPLFFLRPPFGAGSANMDSNASKPCETPLPTIAGFCAGFDGAAETLPAIEEEEFPLRVFFRRPPVFAGSVNMASKASKPWETPLPVIGVDCGVCFCCVGRLGGGAAGRGICTPAGRAHEGCQAGRGRFCSLDECSRELGGDLTAPIPSATFRDISEGSGDSLGSPSESAFPGTCRILGRSNIRSGSRLGGVPAGPRELGSDSSPRTSRMKSRKLRLGNSAEGGLGTPVVLSGLTVVSLPWIN